MSAIYQNLMYPLMNVLSSSFNFIFSFLMTFCTNGEKNISAANESWILVWLFVSMFLSINCWKINVFLDVQ